MTWPHGSGLPASGLPASGLPASGIPASGIPASGIRASGTERAPLAQGQVLSLRSGHRSPRVTGALAKMLIEGLEADRPDLAAYPEAMAAWATAEAVAALLRKHLAEVGAVDPATSQPRTSSLGELRRAEAAAAKHRALLGLDPRSEAELARDRAQAVHLAVVDIDALAERGRAALAARDAAREAAGLPPAPEPPDLAALALEQVRAEGVSTPPAAIAARATPAAAARASVGADKPDPGGITPLRAAALAAAEERERLGETRAQRKARRRAERVAAEASAAAGRRS